MLKRIKRKITSPLKPRKLAKQIINAEEKTEKIEQNEPAEPSVVAPEQIEQEKMENQDIPLTNKEVHINATVLCMYMYIHI